MEWSVGHIGNLNLHDNSVSYLGLDIGFKFSRCKAFQIITEVENQIKTLQ